MRNMVYALALKRRGLVYIGEAGVHGGARVLCGYNKAFRQYSFWEADGLDLRLLEVCRSKKDAKFKYRLFYRS